MLFEYKVHDVGILLYSTNRIAIRFPCTVFQVVSTETFIVSYLELATCIKHSR